MHDYPYGACIEFRRLVSSTAFCTSSPRTAGTCRAQLTWMKTQRKWRPSFRMCIRWWCVLCDVVVGMAFIVSSCYLCLLLYDQSLILIRADSSDCCVIIFLYCFLLLWCGSQEGEGFDEGEEYTLKQYRVMADNFREKWWHSPWLVCVGDVGLGSMIDMVEIRMLVLRSWNWIIGIWYYISSVMSLMWGVGWTRQNAGYSWVC